MIWDRQYYYSRRLFFPAEHQIEQSEQERAYSTMEIHQAKMVW